MFELDCDTLPVKPIRRVGSCPVDNLHTKLVIRPLLSIEPSKGVNGKGKAGELSANIPEDPWDSPTLLRLSVRVEEYKLPLTVMTHGCPG